MGSRQADKKRRGKAAAPYRKMGPRERDYRFI